MVAEVETEILRAVCDGGAGAAVERSHRIGGDHGADHGGKRIWIHLHQIGSVGQAAELIAGIRRNDAAADEQGAGGIVEFDNSTDDRSFTAVLTAIAIGVIENDAAECSGIGTSKIESDQFPAALNIHVMARLGAGLRHSGREVGIAFIKSNGVVADGDQKFVLAAAACHCCSVDAAAPCGRPREIDTNVRYARFRAVARAAGVCVMEDRAQQSPELGEAEIS